MKKYGLLIYKVFLCIILVIAIVFVSLAVSNKDQLVVENITLKYFEESVNNLDEEKLKEFVADSENDVLYKNVLKTYNNKRSTAVVFYEFKINSYEMFGNGKYQCYFNLYDVPTCDIEHEGRYMNYLLDTTTTIEYEHREVEEYHEKALVVFVKDGSNGNPFEWKLVRFDKEETGKLN